MQDIKVPDIGDFADVEVIEILVAPGQVIEVDEALVTLESDKASMDVPSPLSGTVREVLVAVGDKVSQGHAVVRVDAAEMLVADRDSRPVVQQSASSSAAPADAGGGYGGAALLDVTVPDIGDFAAVDVIEVLVAPGDTVAADDALVTLESDKASMDVPAPAAGVIAAMSVAVGDKVSAGDRIAMLRLERAPARPLADADGYGGAVDIEAEVLVLGGGPGGYTAAFRAADLGRRVVLVERHQRLGGVCLNVGCIPSKALLHAARVIDEADSFAAHGIRFGAREIDIDALRDWKDGVVERLTGGLAGLARQRRVQVLRGTGRFLDPHHLEVDGGDGARTVVSFGQCIIATGSSAVKLPFLPEDPRIIDSTGALALSTVPQRLLVIGGGIIGLEMATVYHALGARVTVVEMGEGLIAGADAALVRPLHRRLAARYEGIWLGTRVRAVEPRDDALLVHFQGRNEPAAFDRILVAVGRRPNGGDIDAGRAGVVVDGHGFIPVDRCQRTNVGHIFAIGDVVGQPMLAHKAVHEGKVAAEVAAGLPSCFDAKVIPQVAYTDPEVAWVGLTEAECRERGIDHGIGAFPWAASGRALSLGRDEGLTRLVFERPGGRLLGAGMVGPNAGELVAEMALAIETGCDAADIGLTIHPHPTLSETVAMAAEAFEGTITDLYMPKSKAEKR